MVVTLDVSKLSSRLNADAPLNISCMVVTLDVSKLSSWLNADAPLNIACMFVTLEVSQSEISSSKDFWLLNRNDMSATSETSQSLIGPYVAMVAAWFKELYCCTVMRRSKSPNL